MSIYSPNASPILSVSEHEEKTWLLQQQSPEKIELKTSTWSLDTTVDVALFTEAIRDSLRQTPFLNVRYHFTDEGDLQKFHAIEMEQCIQIIQADEIDLIFKRPALTKHTSDAATQAPFRAWIILTTKDRFLVLTRHPILDHIFDEDHILTLIHNHYLATSADKQPLILHKSSAQAFAVNQVRATDDTDEHKNVISVEQISEIILNEFRCTLENHDMTHHDDFFDYGGHSLIATRIIGNLANNYGIEISFDSFFRHPTAWDLANNATLRTTPTTQTVTSSERQNDDTLAPLTLAQTFLWNTHAKCGSSAILNLPFALSFLDHIDEETFFEAFCDILKRHTGLRSTFHTQNGKIYQKIVPYCELDRYKWFWKSSENDGVTLADEAAYVFNLSNELALRVRFIQDPTSGHQTLSLLMHHMIIDEWSLNTVMKELKQAYIARVSKKAPIWETPTKPISSFAVQQNAIGVNQQNLSYWTEKLHLHTPRLRLINHDTQTPRPNSKNNLSAKSIKCTLDTVTYEELLTIAKNHHSTLFGILYASIALALHKRSGLNNLTIGTSASGRTSPDFFETVGYFTTMVAHQVQFSPEQSISELIKETTHAINDSMPYADVPIDIIQHALGMDTDDELLFDVYIQIHANNALNGAFLKPDGAPIRYRQILPIKNESLFGLHFEIMENVFDAQRNVHLVVTYHSDNYSTPQVQGILAEINQILTFLSATNSEQHSKGNF